MKRLSTRSRSWWLCHGLMFVSCAAPRERDTGSLPDAQAGGAGGRGDAASVSDARPDGGPDPTDLGRLDGPLASADALFPADPTTASDAAAEPATDGGATLADGGGTVADAAGLLPGPDAAGSLPAPSGPSGPLDDCRLGRAFDFNGSMTTRDDGAVIAEVPLGLQIFEPPCDSTGASALVAFVAPTDGRYTIDASPLPGEPAMEVEVAVLADCRLPVLGPRCAALRQDEPEEPVWGGPYLGMLSAGQRVYFVIGSDAPAGARVAIRLGSEPAERSERESCSRATCRPPLICEHHAVEDDWFCAAAAPPMVTGVRAQYLAATRSVYVRYAGTGSDGRHLSVEAWAYDEAHEWRSPGTYQWADPVTDDGAFEGELIIENLGFEPTGIQLRTQVPDYFSEVATTVTAPVEQIGVDPRRPDGAPCAYEGGVFECRPGVACRPEPHGGPGLTCQPPPACQVGVVIPDAGSAGPWEVPGFQGFEAPAEGIYSMRTNCLGQVRLGCPDIDSARYELGQGTSYRASFHLDRGERVYLEPDFREVERIPRIDCIASIARPDPSLPILLEAHLSRVGQGRARVRVRGVATEHRIARIDATWIDDSGDPIPGVSPVSHGLEYGVSAGPFELSGLEFGLPDVVPAEARLRLTARDFFDQASETLEVAFEDAQPVPEGGECGRDERFSSDCEPGTHCVVGAFESGVCVVRAARSPVIGAQVWLGSRGDLTVILEHDGHGPNDDDWSVGLQAYDSVGRPFGAEYWFGTSWWRANLVVDGFSAPPGPTTVDLQVEDRQFPLEVVRRFQGLPIQRKQIALAGEPCGAVVDNIVECAAGSTCQTDGGRCVPEQPLRVVSATVYPNEILLGLTVRLGDAAFSPDEVTVLGYAADGTQLHFDLIEGWEWDWPGMVLPAPDDPEDLIVNRRFVPAPWLGEAPPLVRATVTVRSGRIETAPAEAEIADPTPIAEGERCVPVPVGHGFGEFNRRPPCDGETNSCHDSWPPTGIRTCHGGNMLVDALASISPDALSIWTRQVFNQPDMGRSIGYEIQFTLLDDAGNTWSGRRLPETFSWRADGTGDAMVRVSRRPRAQGVVDPTGLASLPFEPTRILIGLGDPADLVEVPLLLGPANHGESCVPSADAPCAEGDRCGLEANDDPRCAEGELFEVLRAEVFAEEGGNVRFEFDVRSAGHGLPPARVFWMQEVDDDLESEEQLRHVDYFFEGDVIRGRAVTVTNRWLDSDLVGLDLNGDGWAQVLTAVEPVARDLGAQCTPNPGRAPCVAGLDCASPDGAQAPVCLPAAMECPPEWNEVELAPPPPHGRTRVRERIWRDGWRGGAPCEPVLTHGDVYGFTAPEAGSYLFNLQAIGARDVGLFARSRCTATPPEPALGCDTGDLSYNRMVRLSLEAGERVHLFVVGQELAETGTPYTLWAQGPTPNE